MPHKHVIGHYYESRLENLEKIILGLNEIGIEPLVWNNGEHLVPVNGEYETVDCPNNPIHGRYLAALIYPESEYFLFQDDDLILDKPSIDLLVGAAASDHSRFFGVEGRRLKRANPTPYSLATPDREGTETDMCIRAYACHRSALKYGLDWILEKGIHPGRCETILFTGGRSRLVEGAAWSNLPENGIGLCYAGNHDSEIDAFVNQWFR